MSTRSLSLALFATLAVVLTAAFPGLSSATFTASTGNSAVVRAAADWTPPTVAVVSPGTAVKDVVTITVQAADAESGVERVTLEQLAPNAGTWVTVCTDATAPYSCAWDTRTLADGQYSLRARATDRAGYETTSEVVRTTVANRLLVVLADPGETARGTVTLTASVFNVGTLNHSVRIQYAPSGSTSWSNLCTGLSTPYTCQWSTTGFANGDYDLRAILVSGSTTTTSSVIEGVTVDNLAPSVSLADPGSPLSGTRTFSVTTSDAHSGVDEVVVQYAVAGTTTWKNLCVIAEEPWSCRVATSTLADGTYDFRAVATDAAGNSATSAVVARRTVDNTVASVTVDVPTRLSGTVTIGATASSSAGVASVRIEVSPHQTGSWSPLCTDTSAPYSCAWDTTTVSDGSYDVRAVMTDSLGHATVSPVDPDHLVDNSPLRGVDVQTSNGGGTPGRVDAGDTVTFTFSTQVAPHSVLAGWDGSARAVSVRLRDGGLLGLGPKADTLDVLAGTTSVNLGSVNLRQDYIRSQRAAQFNATMTATTVTGPQGIQRTTVTLLLGSPSSGGTTTKTVSTASTMVWAPSVAVRDLDGRPSSGAAASETGALDREF